MTNHYVKCEDFVINSSAETMWSIDGQTDRQIDQPTLAKQYTSSSSKGHGHNNYAYHSKIDIRKDSSNAVKFRRLSKKCVCVCVGVFVRACVCV
jgi:hypothetical protein